MQASETPEAWEALLLGLAALCQGLASEPSMGELGSAGQEHYLSQEQLHLLLDRSASAEARSAVLSIAAAQSGSPAAADIQSRRVSPFLARACPQTCQPDKAEPPAQGLTCLGRNPTCLHHTSNVLKYRSLTSWSCI